ncbi:MAG: type 4a pilus biogenesis protein PilO [Pseudomonadota bacterium]|nr:type 4a pilus biogenesis protein PilO [Pseudomonadota bacterium]
MNMNLNVGQLWNELRSLDINNVGSWSIAARGIVVVFVCALLVFLGYWFLVRHQIDNLNVAQKKEPELKQQFERKQGQVANLDAYKQQLEEMRVSFSTMLRQLPSETEMANLLQDISQTRVATGLEEQIFKPEPERPKEFYAEAPIRIRVTGDFHQFGDFASGIAALPRIVTLSGISIKRNGGKGASADSLIMDATAMTYRYVDEPAAKNKRPTKGRKK